VADISQNTKDPIRTHGGLGDMIDDLKLLEGNPLQVLKAINSRSLHPEIPWPKYREEEIIYLLMVHFALLRYSVHSPHFADPSHEAGIDLEATRRDKRVIVAVKKRPQNSDRGQLADLSRSKASQRIYVYISSPTEGFRREMRNIRNVEYWSARKLTLQFVESGLAFGLLFDNSPLPEVMKVIFSLLLSWGNARGRAMIPKLSAKRLAVLWGLKDRAVQLNKGSRIIQIVLERGYERRRMRKNLNLTEELLDLCSTALYQLYMDAALPILRILSSKPDIVRLGVRLAYTEGHARSNWKGLVSFLGRTGSVPGRIIGDEKPEDRMAPMVFKGEPISAIRMHDASSIFRVLSIYAYDLEQVIDDIFNVARDGSSNDVYSSTFDRI